ncbi:MAG TPA: C/D box methylation guide ribonucleoprotein complex aNOP56 subunit [candidate division Zixibacteria bacterium]|nr:C/D box methylation guide ribonucleoprotein complex aNOP56 subunit [candidate division Zixibacteria bacterium]
MKVYLAISLVGIFVLDEEGNIIGVKYFKIDPSEVSKKIVTIERGELVVDIEDVLKDHKKNEIYLQYPGLGRALAQKGFNVLGTYENLVIDNFHMGIVEHVISVGLFKNEKEYRDFLRETTLLITREKVRTAAEKRDRLVVHAIETIDDIDKTLNLFSGRLREFYGMHFPELVDAIDNHYTFALIVGKTGVKENITKELLVDEIKLPESKAESLLASRETSMGSKLLDQDIEIIQEQAKIVADLYVRRQALEKWMEETMTTIAPNICGVTSALIGARLIALAGSLRGLALCPSSKIQVLGAEKALYRTIKTGAPPPKHGIIFQDPRLNQAKWWQRGKIARVISGRLAIAARMDFFEAENKSEDLAKEVNAKIEEIKIKYPEQSEKAPRQFSKRPKSPRPQRSGYNKSKSGSKKPRR